MLEGAIIGHLVGDYLVQNDWMALNKKKATFPCAVHCALWSLSVLVFAQWPLVLFPLLFVTHYVQDRTNIIGWSMQAVGQRKFASGPCAPWSIIVVDNVWHLVVLYFINHFLVST
jgi:hypothetical protein